MPDPEPKPDKLATFPLTRDEVTLFALVHKAKRDHDRRTLRLTIDINADGIFIIEQKEYMRAALAL